jgi:hypothetical protein
MNKPVPLIIVLTVLSFSKGKETKVIILNERGPEILNGNVKQLNIT